MPFSSVMIPKVNVYMLLNSNPWPTHICNQNSTHYLSYSCTIRLIYRLCMPLVSIGNSIIATKDTRYSPPAARMGVEGFVTPVLAATSGAASPASLFNRLAMPDPVPRTGAGNTSGVYA